jgi:hypothetical protein
LSKRENVKEGAMRLYTFVTNGFLEERSLASPQGALSMKKRYRSCTVPVILQILHSIREKLPS